MQAVGIILLFVIVFGCIGAYMSNRNGSQSSGETSSETSPTKNIEFENMDFFDEQFQTVVGRLLSNEELLVDSLIVSLPDNSRLVNFKFANAEEKFNKYIKNRPDAAAVRCKNARSEILRILHEELSQCKEMRVIIPENVKQKAFGFSSMRIALIKYIINLSYIRPRLKEWVARFNALVEGY